MQRLRRNINVATFNANGVARQREELIHFLIEHRIDILLISETHLQPATNFTLPNRTIYRHDRTRIAWGGVLIAISSDIPHYPVPRPALEEEVETVTVVVPAEHGSIAFTSIYNPPGHNLSTQDLDLLTAMHPASITFGDFNAKHIAWGCNASNTSGRKLLEHSTKNNYEVLAPDSPTHFPRSGQRPDILDIATLKAIPYRTSITSINELNSDHNPVLLEIFTTNPCPKKYPLQDRNINWHIFEAHMQHFTRPNHPLNDTDEVDEAIAHLTDTIVEAKNLATTKTPKVTDHTPTPPHIIEMIRNKNKLRKRWQHLHDPADKREINRLQREIQAALLDHRIELWNSSLTSLEIGSTSYWKFVRNRIRKPSKMHAIHGSRGAIVFTPHEKAEALADTLELQFRSEENEAMEEQLEQTIEHFAQNLQNEPPIAEVPLTTPKEIKKTTKRLKSNKSPGPDGVTSDDLKHLTRKPLSLLTRIFNSCLQYQYFPNTWKEAKIISLHKQGKNPLFPQNYRPISLLSQTGKVFERIILARIITTLQTHNTIRNEQFGFRPGHSAPLQALRITETITKHFNRKGITVAVFFDVQKAFDSVWHEALLYKMSTATPIARYLIKLIASFLAGRTFHTYVERCKSTIRQIEAGVPQGSVLSPTLYSIYINDLPIIHPCKLALYADDTAFYCTTGKMNNTINKVQRNINSFAEWCEKWRITVNAEKTQAIYFTKRRPVILNHLNMNGAILPWRKSIKYLGVHMDRTLSWNTHATKTKGQAQQRYHKLFPLLQNNIIPLRTRINIFKAYILPIMTYACITWGNTAITNLNKVQTVQNKILRTIAGQPRYVRNADIRNEYNIPTLRAHMKKLAAKTYARIRENEGNNEELDALGNYFTLPNWKHKLPNSLLNMPD